MDDVNGSSPLIAPQEFMSESRRSLNVKAFLIFVGIMIILATVAIVGYYVIRKPQETPQVTNQPENPTATPIPIPNIPGIMTYIQNGNVFIKLNTHTKQITTDASYTQTGASIDRPSLTYSYPAVSPDKTKVVYFQTTVPPSLQNPTKISLYVSNVDGTGQLALITKGSFDTRLAPPLWLKDSQSVLVSTLDTNNQSTNFTSYVVLKINVVTGTQQQILSYSVLQGCGGGRYDPSQILAGAEGAKLLNTPIFTLSSDNNYFLNNLDCAGYGVSVHNLQTNLTTPLSNTLSQAIFSPDASKIATIAQNNQILLFDTSGKQIGSISTSQHPESLYWSKDGQTLYYGSFTVTKHISSKPDSLGNVLEGDQHAASLWSIGVDGSNEKKIEDYDAYAIKPIYVEPDNSKAIVVEVDNATDYIQGFNQSPVSSLTPLAPTSNIVTTDINATMSAVTTQNAQNAQFYPLQ